MRPLILFLFSGRHCLVELFNDEKKINRFASIEHSASLLRPSNNKREECLRFTVAGIIFTCNSLLRKQHHPFWFGPWSKRTFIGIESKPTYLKSLLLYIKMKFGIWFMMQFWASFRSQSSGLLFDIDILQWSHWIFEMISTHFWDNKCCSVILRVHF